MPDSLGARPGCLPAFVPRREGRRPSVPLLPLLLLVVVAVVVVMVVLLLLLLLLVVVMTLRATKRTAWKSYLPCQSSATQALALALAQRH